jgi:hypothetical protein
VWALMARYRLPEGRGSKVMVLTVCVSVYPGNLLGNRCSSLVVMLLTCISYAQHSNILKQSGEMGGEVHVCLCNGVGGG